MTAASSPSESPSVTSLTYCESANSPATAIAPARMPAATGTLPPGTRRRVRRKASSNASASAINPPARETISHRFGAAEPNGASSIVNRTGSGFHDGPPVVTRCMCSTWRPQITHDQAS